MNDRICFTKRITHFPTMKKIIQLLLLLLVVAGGGCATQKQAGKSDKAEAGALAHRQALEALESRMFIIKADEFFLKPGKAPIRSPGSYIYFQGNTGVRRFEQKVMYYSSYDRLYIEDHAAEIRKERVQKNGNVEYALKIKKEDSMMTGWMLLTLYANSNRCMVILDGMYYGRRFSGVVLPYYKESAGEQ